MEAILSVWNLVHMKYLPVKLLPTVACLASENLNNAESDARKVNIVNDVKIIYAL